MNIVGIIPARMASSRFPGKPMKKILGIPMIGHCYLRSKMSSILEEVYVATCDDVIYNYIKNLGGKPIMTSDKHERASDRVSEALLKIESNKEEKCEIVVLIQGDEPMVTPAMIDGSVKPLIKDSSILVSNLMSELKSKKEHEDPNEIKVVVDKNNNALYFSREPIPSRKKGAKNISMHKQVCIISFQRDFLIKYNSMSQTPLEIIESIDMLRILENGLDVKMVPIRNNTYAVDTKKDLIKVQSLMKNDPLLDEYTEIK